MVPFGIEGFEALPDPELPLFIPDRLGMLGTGLEVLPRLIPELFDPLLRLGNFISVERLGLDCLDDSLRKID